MAERGVAWLLAASVLLSGGIADARAPKRFAPGAVQEFSDAEQRTLFAGKTVSRPVRFERGAGGSYVGGVSYQVVKATPAEVIRALADVNALPHALPRTLSAELLSSTGTSARVELTQGKAPFVVRYTVHLEQTQGGDEIRFWLDPTRPHDVRDVWGYFRVSPFPDGRSLVTVAVALDLGPGIKRLLFEDGVERIILRSPDKIRAFVEPRALVAD